MFIIRYIFRMNFTCSFQHIWLQSYPEGDLMRKSTSRLFALRDKFSYWLPKNILLFAVRVRRSNTNIFFREMLILTGDARHKNKTQHYNWVSVSTAQIIISMNKLKLNYSSWHFLSRKLHLQVEGWNCFKNRETPRKKWNSKWKIL